MCVLDTSIWFAFSLLILTNLFLRTNIKAMEDPFHIYTTYFVSSAFLRWACAYLNPPAAFIDLISNPKSVPS